MGPTKNPRTENIRQIKGERENGWELEEGRESACRHLLSYSGRQ